MAKIVSVGDSRMNGDPRGLIAKLAIAGVAFAVGVGSARQWISPTALQAWMSRLGQKMLEDMHYLLPALLGVFIIWYEGRLRLGFEKEKFAEEKEERRERREFLEREAITLRGVSSLLADQVAEQLVGDTKWASEALERAKLGPHAKTLFGERVGHFHDEKDYLAEKFLPHLLRRCRALVESGNEVKLLIDSGTTLYPLLTQLGHAAVRAHENREKWIEKVEVVTNNLPGMEALMDSGRSNPNNRYSPLAIKCQLLPGAPLPVYSALTGKKAEEAIANLKSESDPTKTVFIGLVTGNWIRLRRTQPVCPVPMARGEGHKAFKEALVNASDEVYVIATLGKVFFQFSLHEVNRALGFKEEHADPDRKPYEEVTIDDAKASHVKLVTTSREQGRVLFQLSVKVQATIDSHSETLTEYVDQNIPPPDNYIFPFDQLPANWYLELETEFPHQATRGFEFTEKYFFVMRRPRETVSKAFS